MAYLLNISADQARWMAQAMQRFHKDVADNKVKGLQASDPASAGMLCYRVGSTVGEELEALVDMLADLEPEGVNDFTS
jgi:hypothetical protein